MGSTVNSSACTFPWQSAKVVLLKPTVFTLETNGKVSNSTFVSIYGNLHTMETK